VTGSPVDLCIRDVLARAARLWPGELAVVSQDRTVTWHDLQDRARRLANAMSARGVGPGDRVGISQPNAVELVEVAFACALLGAVVVPISPRLVPAEVRHIVTDSGVVLAFAGEAEAPRFEGVRTVRTDEPEYESLIAAASAEEPPQVESADDAALQLYTSGTTGRPKGALLSHRALIQNGLTTLLSQGIGHGDVFLTATPLTHAAAATRIVTLAVDGLTHVILDRYRPSLLLEAIERHRVTMTLLVPTMLSDLLDDPALPGADRSSLRTIVYGAAPCPADLVARAVAELPCGLLQGYGLTEGSPQLVSMSPAEHRRFAASDEHRDRLGSIGRPVPGVRVRVVDTEGAPVPVGAPGELQVRSTKAMLGYWNIDGGDTFVDGWLRTGDVVVEDAEGYLYLVDRAKDMLISGGVNVYPSEIERVLRAAPQVRDVAVVGVPHPRWGEVPVAFVVAAGGELSSADREALEARCRAELAPYKRPSSLVTIDELPLNATGKVSKTMLRELAAAGEGPR
jgi:acyl-CoA synthetase (AMP-forming)/AMP-acid ligase II